MKAFIICQRKGVLVGKVWTSFYWETDSARECVSHTYKACLPLRCSVHRRTRATSSEEKSSLCSNAHVYNIFYHILLICDTFRSLFAIWNIWSSPCFIHINNPSTGLEKPLGFQEVEVPRTSRQSAYEGGKVVSPTHRPPLAARRYPWYSFLLDAESIPG